jgi:hypothetical protein
MKVVDGKDALDPTLSRMYSTAKTKISFILYGFKTVYHRPVSAETAGDRGQVHCKTLWYLLTSDSLAAMYATMLNVPFYL